MKSLHSFKIKIGTVKNDIIRLKKKCQLIEVWK